MMKQVIKFFVVLGKHLADATADGIHSSHFYFEIMIELELVMAFVPFVVLVPKHAFFINRFYMEELFNGIIQCFMFL
jgi:hypothetical protein